MDFASDVTAIGSLLVGLATLGGVIDNRRRTKGLQTQAQEIHETVNGVAGAQTARVEQLADVITDAGIVVPPRPASDPHTS